MVLSHNCIFVARMGHKTAVGKYDGTGFRGALIRGRIDAGLGGAFWLRSCALIRAFEIGRTSPKMSFIKTRRPQIVSKTAGARHQFPSTGA